MRNGHGHSSPSVQRAREKMDARLMKDGGTGRVLGDNVDLSVPLEELDDGPVEIHEDLPTQYVTTLLDDGNELRWRGRAPSHIDLTLDKEAGFVRVIGAANLALVHPCVRCLNDVPFDVPLKIDLRLVQREKPLVIEDEEQDEAFADDALDATALEDLDVASFSDGIVAMGDVLREQLFLELPMHPACDSPRARPTGPCNFVEPKSDPGWVDSRWAGLAALRDKLPPGPPAAGPSMNKAPAAKPTPITPSKPAVATAPLPAKAAAEPALKNPTPAKPEPKKAAPKKAAPKKAAPKKAAPKKAAPKKAEAKKAEAKKASPKKRAPKKVEKGAAKTATAKKAARKPATKAKAPTKKTAKKKSTR